MEALNSFLVQVVDVVWGLPLVVFLLLSGIFLCLRSMALPFRGFFHAWALVLGFHKKEENAPGQISHFAALCNALAATVGFGNISGVAVAITTGGPGAVFWMWVSALIGMNTKFFECTLAVMYRGKNYLGEVEGGPMYVIKNALPKQFHFLAVIFAVCAMLGTLSLFNVNQLAQFNEAQFSLSPYVTAVFCTLFVAVVLFGGLKGIAQTTSALVPTMCLLYVGLALVILAMNMDKILPTFGLIFQAAFNPQSVWGGVLGATFASVMRTGVQRAAFSNEAGMGTAPMAHANAKTSEAVREGLVASIGPFLDTIVVCTMTALVILISCDSAEILSNKGIDLTRLAFSKNLGVIGSTLLGVVAFLFSLSTMLGMANYNKKCWDFLFRGKLKTKAFILFYSATVFMGAVSSVDIVLNLLDIGFALMCIPNLIVTVALSGKVMKELKIYYAKSF